MLCLRFRIVLLKYIRETQAIIIALADAAICDSLVVNPLVQNAGKLYVRVAVKWVSLAGGIVRTNFVTVALRGIPVLRQGATRSLVWGPRYSGIVAKRNWVSTCRQAAGKEVLCRCVRGRRIDGVSPRTGT